MSQPSHITSKSASDPKLEEIMIFLYDQQFKYDDVIADHMIFIPSFQSQIWRDQQVMNNHESLQHISLQYQFFPHVDLFVRPIAAPIQIWLIPNCPIIILTTMSKRFREAFVSSVKPAKRFRGDDEETRVEDEPANPGALKLFLKNKRTIELLESKGIKALFPIQYRTFEHILAGRDVKAKDKTGSGKTLAFSLPIIERFRKEKVFGQGKDPKFLIMLPTRELVIQVVNNIEGLRLEESEFQVVGVYGGDSIGRQAGRLSRGVDIVVATPGRLIDMLERAFISLSSIQVVCLDEADEMLKQGFQDSIELIFSKINKQRKEPTQNLLFSATFPQWVNELSAKYQSKDTQMIDLVPKQAETPSTITHYLIECNNSSPAKLVQKLISHFVSKDGRTIIFCETKRQVNQLWQDLGKNCGMLHGDVRQQEREAVYRDFKAGRITIVVATNVAARGLDFPDIQLVIQTEPPREVESFIHRAGRTGRAGKTGVNVLMHSEKQGYALQKIQSANRFAFKTLGSSDLEGKKR